MVLESAQIKTDFKTLLDLIKETHAEKEALGEQIEYVDERGHQWHGQDHSSINAANTQASDFKNLLEHSKALGDKAVKFFGRILRLPSIQSCEAHKIILKNVLLNMKNNEQNF